MEALASVEPRFNDLSLAFLKIEFITFYQNALHLTRVHCATFYQNALRQRQLNWKHDEECALFAAQTQSFLCGKFSTARLEVLPNLRHAGVFQMSTMVNLGIGFQSKSLWLVHALNLKRRWTFALRLRNTGDIQIPAFLEVMWKWENVVPRYS